MTDGERSDNGREAGRSVLIKNLRFETSPAKVRRIFEEFGTVRDVYLPLDFYTKRPRGFGFVEFIDARDAEAAVRAVNKTFVEGNEVTVVTAQDRRKSPETMRTLTTSGRSSSHGGRFREPHRREHRRSVSREDYRHEVSRGRRDRRDDYYYDGGRGSRYNDDGYKGRRMGGGSWGGRADNFGRDSRMDRNPSHRSLSRRSRSGRRSRSVGLREPSSRGKSGDRPMRSRYQEYRNEPSGRRRNWAQDRKDEPQTESAPENHRSSDHRMSPEPSKDTSIANEVTRLSIGRGSSSDRLKEHETINQNNAREDSNPEVMIYEQVD